MTPYISDFLAIYIFSLLTSVLVFYYFKIEWSLYSLMIKIFLMIIVVKIWIDPANYECTYPHWQDIYTSLFECSNEQTEYWDLRRKIAEKFGNKTHAHDDEMEIVRVIEHHCEWWYKGVNQSKLEGCIVHHKTNIDCYIKAIKYCYIKTKIRCI